MAEKRDYYEVLGVNKNSSADEIKKAYRTMAMKYHPDRWVNGTEKEKKEAEEKFKEAAEAYDVLSTPEKKSRYDQFGHAGVSGAAGGSGFGGGFDISDIFSRFGDIFGGGGFGGFGDIFGGGGYGSSQRVRRGSNIRIKIKLTLEEVATATEKKVKINKHVPCDHCHGTGAKNEHSKETCPTCHGRGQVTQQRQSMFGVVQQVSECPQCHGSGEIIKDPCPHCHGSGVKQAEEIIQLNIPAGVDNGMQIKMQGKGNAAPNGGVNGDLLVAFEVAEHAIFERDGNNLYLNHYISFPQAALGDTVEIPTLTGKVKVKIAPGTQSGQILRLQGKGLPELNTKNVGDLIVNVNVWTPKTLSKEEKELVKKLCDKENFVPKPGKNERSVFNRVRQFFRD